jgi:iron(III) transport system permease protein
VMLLIIAYSYRLAVTTRLSRAALMQIHGELEEASYMSGGTWLTTLKSIVLPLLSPALMASFLLLFIIGFREFTLPTILQSDENTVISVIMWQLFGANKIPQAAAVGVLIMIFVTPVIFLMRRLLQHEGRT